MTNPKNLRITWSFWLVIAYIFLFLVVRLTNITSFPLFIDETTHIFLADATLDGDIFVGLRETHKQIYIWLTALAFQFFNDPILAARVVSVLAGLVSSGIGYKLAEVFYPNRQIGYLALLFYLISPFVVLYDRMAMADSMQAMLMGASLLASFYLWRYPSTQSALILGIVFGLATFNKGYAALYYPAPIFFWLVLGRGISWRQIIKLLAITYAMASVAWLLLFSIGWHIYLRDLMTKSIANASDESHFLIRFSDAIWLFTDWLSIYLTLPLVGLLIFTLVTAVIKQDKPVIALALVSVSYLFIMALTFVELRSRYILPVIIPLSVIVARGIDHLAELVPNFVRKFRSDNNGRIPMSPKLWQVVLFAVFGIASLRFSYLIISKPDQAPLPDSDKYEYVIRAQSPYGYREAAQLITELVQRHGRLIYLQHSLPSPPEVIVRAYLPDEVAEQIDILPIVNLDQITPQSLNQYAAQAPTLTMVPDLIRSNSPDLITYRQLWPIASFSLADHPSSVGLYQWLLPPDFAMRWLIQGGDVNPHLAWDKTNTPITTVEGTSIDWPRLTTATPEAVQQALLKADIEYVLATPALINQNADLFAPFITSDGLTLTLKQFPPGWRLAFCIA